MQELYHFDSEAAILSRLQEYVTMETPSEDWERIYRLYARMAEEMTAAGCRVSGMPGDGCHLLRADVGHGDQRLLLLGHVDTVFPVGETSENPFRTEERDGETLLRGPGVLDMKAGDVMILELMRHFAVEESLGHLKGFTVTALFNGDEETGSHHSERVIRETARGCTAVFVMEPSIPGMCTIERKGLASYEITATGKAAHSGVNYQKGASAIEALCRVISQIYDLRDDERNISINIGSITAPGKNNVVSDHAVCRGEARSYDPVLLRQTLERISELCAASPVPGTKLNFRQLGLRPAMVQSPEMKRLHEMARQSAARHGLAMEGRVHGGGSDGSFVAEEGVPVLDGLGAEGDGAHTQEEYALAGTLMPRLMTVCDVMMRIVRQSNYCASKRF